MFFLVSSLKCYKKDKYGEGLTDCSGMAGGRYYKYNTETEILTKEQLGDVKYCFKMKDNNGVVKGCAHDLVSEAVQSLGLWGAGCVDVLDGHLQVCLCSTDLCNSSHKLKISMLPFIILFMFLYAMNL